MIFSVDLMTGCKFFYQITSAGRTSGHMRPAGRGAVGPGREQAARRPWGRGAGPGTSGVALTTLWYIIEGSV